MKEYRLSKPFLTTLTGKTLIKMKWRQPFTGVLNSFGV